MSEVPVPGDRDYELVMPLVATADHGGPFDASAYAAGLEAGSIMRLLWSVHSEVRVVSSTVRTANVPQLDLFAMHYGFTLRHRADADNDFWSYATFIRGATVEYHE